MCSHNIVEDYIDINPDDFTQIFYCDKCFITYGFEEYICCQKQLIAPLNQLIDLSLNNELNGAHQDVFPISNHHRFKPETPQQCSSILSYSLHESEAESSYQKSIPKDHENCNNHNPQFQENPSPENKCLTSPKLLNQDY